jgi:regulation of enolase protein 1 (concanavalin A-like superfamily)
MSTKTYERDVYTAYFFDIDDYSATEMSMIYCKGRVEPEEFCRRAKHQEDFSVEPADVQYMVVRNVPLPKGSDMSFMILPSKPGRGAYPITYAEDFQI